MKFRIHLPLLLLIVIGFGLLNGTTSNVKITKPNKNDFNGILREPPQIIVERQITLAEDPDWPFDVWISGGSYQPYSADRNRDTAMYGSFEVLSSVGIDFFICDQENYDLWTGGQTASVYELSYNVGSKDWEFIAPYTDRWYLMYDNTDNLFNQAHVVGTHRLDITEPTVTCNLVNGQTYSGTIDITVTASDEGFGVYDIQLYIDGALVDHAFDDTLTYSWETSAFGDGEHAVRVEASDEADHTNTLEVDVSVSNLPGLLIPIIIVGVGAPVFIGVVFVLYRKMKPSEQVHTGPEPVIERVAPQPIAFCPSCGAARQPPTARYCNNCGAAFPD